MSKTRRETLVRQLPDAGTIIELKCLLNVTQGDRDSRDRKVEWGGLEVQTVAPGAKPRQTTGRLDDTSPAIPDFEFYRSVALLSRDDAAREALLRLTKKIGNPAWDLDTITHLVSHVTLSDMRMAEPLLAVVLLYMWLRYRIEECLYPDGKGGEYFKACVLKVVEERKTPEEVDKECRQRWRERSRA